MTATSEDWNNTGYTTTFTPGTTGTAGHTTTFTPGTAGPAGHYSINDYVGVGANEFVWTPPPKLEDKWYSEIKFDLGYKPEMVWIKNDAGNNWYVFDTTRGKTKFATLKPEPKNSVERLFDEILDELC